MGLPKEVQEKMKDGSIGKKELHKTVVHAVNSSLVEINQKQMLSKSTREKISVTLELLQHATEIEDALFVDVDSSDDTLCEDEDGEITQEDDSLAFTVWVLSHLLRLLPHKTEESVRSYVIVTISKILESVKQKSSYRFTRLLCEFISAAGELANAFPLFFEEKPLDFMELTKFVCTDLSQSRQASEEYVHRPTILRHPESCERLQVGISQILLQHVVDVSELCEVSPLDVDDGAVRHLWFTVVSQLRDGEVLLKTISIQLADRLMVHSIDLPELKVKEFFASCLAALVEILASGHNQCKGDYKALERALAQCLQTFFEVFREHRDDADDESQEVLDAFLKELVDRLSPHGLSALKTIELKSCICETIVELTEVSAYEGAQLLLLAGSRDAMAARIIDELGDEISSQYCVQLLWLCVKDDIMHQRTCDFEDEVSKLLGDQVELNLHLVAMSPPSCPSQESQDSMCDTEFSASTSDCDWETDDEEELEEETPLSPVDYEEKSKTLTRLLDRMEQLLESLASQTLNQRGVCNAMEGIRVLVEVIVWSCCSDESEICEWINEVTLKKLMAGFHSLLLRLAGLKQDELDDETVSAVVHRIACVFGGLLFVPGLARYETDMFSDMVGILSMHWIPNDMTWSDFKPQNHKSLMTIAGRLGERIDDVVLGECVSVLSLIPKNSAGEWRTRVLRAALGDTRARVREGAVKNFPIFLHHMGPNSNPLVHQALSNVMKDDDVGVLGALAEILGLLACVVSRKAVLKTPYFFVENHQPWECVEVCCTVCTPTEDGEEDEETAAEHRNRPSLVDPNMFVPFLKLVNCLDEHVRFKFIYSFERIFGHINIRKNNQKSFTVLVECMKLLADQSYNLRAEFSERFPEIVQRYGGDVDVGEEIVSRMVQILRDAGDMRAEDVSETVLHTAGALVGVTTDSFQESVICVVLVNCICVGNDFVKAVAQTQLIEAANAMEMPMKEMFQKYCDNLCLMISKHLRTKQSQTKSPKATTEMLEDISELFGYESTRVFLDEVMRTLLPYIVEEPKETAGRIVRAIADGFYRPKTHKMIIVDHLKYIYCHLTLHHKTSKVHSILSHIADDVQLPLNQFIKAGSDMDVHLVMHLGQNYHQVVSGLKCLLLYQDCSLKPTDVDKSKLVESLQEKLLGILLNVDQRLTAKRDLPISEKRKTYNSFIAIMELMGKKSVTMVRMRIIHILKTCQSESVRFYPDLCIRAWKVFVESVDITCLGSMLSQIAVCLQPLLTVHPDQVLQIFQFLIVDNRKKLDSYFPELYFLPDIPLLADINRVISDGIQEIQSLERKIALLTSGITHESMDVRHVALSKLRSLLHDNQKELHSLVVKEERVSPVVADLIHTLLDGCNISSPEVRGLCGECLGELGAIDPGRLQSLKGKGRIDDLATFSPVITTEIACVNLINELANAFLRASDRDTVTCVSYTLQTLIKHYEIVDSSVSDTAGAKLFGKFTFEVQDILKPLMTSRYTITLRNFDWSSIERPIYQSRKGRTFRDWIKAFTGFLMSKVRNEETQNILKACTGTVKHEHNIALFLLPYVVTQIVLDGSDEDRNEIKREMLAVLNHVKEADGRHGDTSDLRHMCAQTVFSLLDHLTKFTRHRVRVLSSMSSRVKTRPHLDQHRLDDDKSYNLVKRFMDDIPQDLLAAASLNCGAYTRALRHLERYISKTSLQDQLDALQKLYVHLDEPDGVAGVCAVSEDQPSLQQQILAYESTGQLSDASACYDKIIVQQPDELQHRQSMLACRLSMGELDTAMQLCNGIISDKGHEWARALNQYRVEAAWKLGEWNNLEGYLVQEDFSWNWNIGVGKALLAVKREEEDAFAVQTNLLRDSQMTPLSAASMETGSYYRGYDHIIRLHLLNELERGANILFNLSNSESHSLPCDDLNDLRNQWQARLNSVQVSYKTREPILSLRRTILMHMMEETQNFDLRRDIGRCWLESARLALESGLVQTAHSSLISAGLYRLPEYDFEYAKWLWERGNKESAVLTLEKALAADFPAKSRFLTPDQNVHLPEEKRIVCAQMWLLLAMYREETSSLESNEMIKQYKGVTALHSEWEDGWFNLAQYYDKVMMKTGKEGENQPEQRSAFIQNVVTCFGRSLKYGNQYIYQSMPRMLTLWLDYGARVSELEKEYARRERKQILNFSMPTIRSDIEKLNKCMNECSKSLASYQFLTAFPQLISRICMTHSGTFAVMSGIIVRVLRDFPQQAMWQMMAVSKSTMSMRADRCRAIFLNAPVDWVDGNKLRQFLQDATKLTDQLLDVCNRKIEGTTASVSKTFSKLQQLLRNRNFSKIVLPLESMMTVTLPTGEGRPSAHDPFPFENIYITKIEDTVEVLSSLAKPKKITLLGSDGRLYVMMCKPKDDLRKDARLMEFNSIVNKCLRKHPEARRRDLRIRTYTVTPLNEECGLLEWVNHTNGLRVILLKMYRERHLTVTANELRALNLPPNESHDKKLAVYRKLLPRHPALFGEWLLNTFPDPTSWYNARLNYCRTSAVMCMVGYILGLGDRHGENILFDSTNGDTVHVDFNCLFNKGLEFDYPEVVPFRMTHNLEKAMGPLKCEGVFRKSCEVTLRVMRNQMGPLMSVLNTFVYDPLVEWSKPAKGKSSQTVGVAKNKAASERVGDIEARMNGTINKKKGLPLSVEGQVSHLIKEATDENNLCRMYIGWAAYM